MWLKSYLNLEPSQALWADYADAILAMNTPKTEKNVKPEMWKNIFLQTWKSYTGSHWNNKNPTDLKNLIDTAKKFGLQMEVHTTDIETARLVPIWIHAQADRKNRQIALSQTSKCLLRTHSILTVGDIADLANQQLTDGHRESWYCECDACTII